MENENADDVLRRSSVFRRLADQGVTFSDFHALAHPSYPNYLAMVAGHVFDTTDKRVSPDRRASRSRGFQRDGDAQLRVDAPSIVDLLEARGLDWRAYAENYPGHCNLWKGGARGLYARKHVPFLSFAAIQDSPERCAHVTGLKEGQSLLEVIGNEPIPAYMFVTPNMVDDGHDMPVWHGRRPAFQIAAMSDWLDRFLQPLIANREFYNSTLIVVTFDEAESSNVDNRIFTLFLGGMVKPGVVSSVQTHYNVLRTIEAAFDVGPIAHGDSCAAPITGIWKQ